MRRLVKLAYAKREKLASAEANTLPLSSNGKKKKIKKSQTMTNVRVHRGTSTEQKVAHRLSVTMNQQKQVAETLHIRSFSLPKEKTPQVGDEPQNQQNQPNQHSNNNNNSNINHENEDNDHQQHQHRLLYNKHIHQ